MCRSSVAAAAAAAAPVKNTRPPKTYLPAAHPLAQRSSIKK